MKRKVTKAIIPVAGFGTRFLPATKAIPKEMLPVVDKPVVQYLVEEAIESGIETIIFVTNKNKQSIADHFSRSGELESMLLRAKKSDLFDKIKYLHKQAKFLYVMQEKPLGTGDALMRARELIGQEEPFAWFHADDIVVSKSPAIGQLIGAYEKYGGPILGLFKVPKQDTKLYGVVKGKKISARTTKIDMLVEKPDPKDAPSQLASMGRFILTPDIFPKIVSLREIWRRQTKTKKVRGELYLSDAVDMLAKEIDLYGYELEGTWYDCGSKSGFLRANIEIALGHPELKKEARKILREA